MRGTVPHLKLDIIRDVEQIVNILQNDKVKAAKYRKIADTKFLKGSVTVLIATEPFELGVDNSKSKQVIWISARRNLGVLLQEFDQAGRKAGMVASGFSIL